MKSGTRSSRSARFDLPVRHPPLWRFVLDELTGPARRLHHYRRLSERMILRTLDELESGDCE